MAYSGKTPKRNPIKSLVGLGFVVAATFGAVYLFQQRGDSLAGDLKAVERDAPVLAWRDLPKGLPGEPIELDLTVSDEGTGVGHVVVSIAQNEIKHDLVDIRPPNPIPGAGNFKVPVNARALGLKEGEAVLTVTASDSSLWGNSASLETRLPVNFTKSRLEVLSTQQNGSVGGVEFVIYRLVGHAYDHGGVEAGGRVYPSYPIAIFDAAVTGKPDVFGSLFPIRYDLNMDTEKFRVNVTDEFGTPLTAPFNYKIAKKKFPAVDMKLTDQFVNTKVPELLDALRSRDPAVHPSGDNYADFKLINETLRKLNEAEIQKALQGSTVHEKLWSGVFVRPLAAAPKATFAEKRTYKHGNESVSESLHMGIDLADVLQAAVHASNRGQVIFVGELGIYGNAIIIDHGLGVTSLYGHLSSISVNVGDIVANGQEIARTGATGLAGGDHLHFEIRVQGVPVSPFEWWDPLWIKQHVEGKIGEVLAPPQETPANERK